MRSFNWILINGFFILLLWGASTSHPGAENALAFMIWLSAALVIINVIGSAIDPDIKKKIQAQPYAINRETDIAYDLVFTGGLAFIGWEWYAVLYIITHLTMHGLKIED